MAALAGNFLFVTNVGNQAALPLVRQDPLNTVAEPFVLCVAGQPVLQALARLSNPIWNINLRGRSR